MENHQRILFVLQTLKLSAREDDFAMWTVTAAARISMDVKMGLIANQEKLVSIMEQIIKQQCQLHYTEF